MKLYPLKFMPIYKEKIWGGKKLQTFFNRKLPGEDIGESWEVAAHKNGTSIISNGSYQGTDISTLFKKFPEEVLGKNTNYDNFNKFPLLIKIIDANDKLSVQVHPDDEYAQKEENELGKTEMWYILDAKKDAKLVYGLKEETDKDSFKTAIENGQLEDYLNEITVKKGDIIYIPSGTVHAIEEGILLAEIQQNSDTTYRVYDWDRSDENGISRELHVNKALEVSKFQQGPGNAKSRPLRKEMDGYIRYFLVACKYFITEKIEVQREYNINPCGNRPYVLMNITGQASINYKDLSYNFGPGDTFFLPASLNNVQIDGEVEFLLSYLPSRKEDLISELKDLGFSQKEIEGLSGLNDW
ncbi:MAG: type I phosphomannose isomerase catalytic subunit [Halanaerobiaceae bacterium]